MSLHRFSHLHSGSLTRDKARRIAVNIAKLSERSAKAC